MQIRNVSLINHLVRHTLQKLILDQSLSGSIRITLSVGVPGHLITNGVQDYQSTEQPGPAAIGILEEKVFIKIERIERMVCYYKSSPTRKEYLKRVHPFKKEQHPISEIREQRLAD